MKAIVSNKKLLSYIFLLVILLFLIYYLSNNLQLIEKIKLITFSDFWMISSFTFLFFIANGARTKVLTELFLKRKLVFYEWFGIAMLNTLGNYSPFQGGLVARGYYLKNYYKIPYTYFVSSMVASTIISFVVFSFISLVMLLINAIIIGESSAIIILFYSTVFLGGISLLFLMPRGKKIRGDSRLIKYFNYFLSGWDILIKNKDSIAKLIFIDVAFAIIIATRFYLISGMISAQISFYKSTVISLGAMFSLLLNITPGAIGIREAISGLFSNLLGGAVTDAVLVAGIESAVLLLWVIIIGIPFSYYFNHKVNRK